MSNARFSILQARAVRDTRISDSQFRTLAALGMYADEDGWCFPSLTTIGKDLEKSKQAVGRDTIALRKLGYLEVQARYNENGGRRSCLYRLRYDLPPRQHGVDTPSTSGVDTPSTSGVDVNDPKNDPSKYGADAPNETWKIGDQELPMDWQVGLGTKLTTISEEELFKKQARDAANMIEQGCAGGGELAYAFMITRQIIIPETKAKGQRRAAKEMLEAKVKAIHVIEATKQLMEAKDKKGNSLTCVDLFSISKIAINIANQPIIGDPNYVRPEHKPFQEKTGNFVPPPADLGRPGKVSG